MPLTLERLDAPESTPGRYRWTRGQCEHMREAGILTGRYELIDGEVISKAGQNPRHATATGLLLDWLADEFGVSFIRVQQAAGVAAADPEHNDPEPDVVVTREPRKAYAGRHPGPEDTLLIAEVSDSTLRFDRTTKGALYAAAGYAEYWIVDLTSRQLLVHRDPARDGYREITGYREDEEVSLLARPQAAIRVGDLLP